MDTLAFPLSCKSIDDTGHIEGLAAAFGNVDAGNDRVLHGAFARTLAERGGRPLPMLLHHDHKRPAGAWTEIRETPEGLHVKGRFTLASRDGAEAHALARDGALGGLSVGYRAIRHTIGSHQGRELHEMSLHETSLVAVPMNDRARILSVKSIANVDDIRELFRSVGMSSRQASAAAGAAWRTYNKADDETAGNAELAALFNESAVRLAL